MNYTYFDIHSHLHSSDFDADRDAVLVRMKENGVGTITIGTDVGDSIKAVELAEKEDLVWASIGVHPQDNKTADFDENIFEKLAQSKKVVAVGECGLEYFNLEGDIETEKKRQKQLFQKHIDFAKEHNLPLMVHARPSKNSMDAYNDVFEMVKDSGVRGNMHFFAGDLEVAKKFLSIGFTLSFTGVITFARQYDEVIKYAPLESIMAETDAPYVAPVPYRGKRNEPSFVVEVYKTIAEIREEDMEKVRLAIKGNTDRLIKFQVASNK